MFLRLRLLLHQLVDALDRGLAACKASRDFQRQVLNLALLSRLDTLIVEAWEDVFGV